MGRARKHAFRVPIETPEETAFLDPENRARHEKAYRIQKEAESWEDLPKTIAKIIRELEIDFEGDATRRRDFLEAYFATPFIVLESRERECAALSIRNVTPYRKNALFHEMHILGLAIRHLRTSMKTAIAKEFPE